MPGAPGSAGEPPDDAWFAGPPDGHRPRSRARAALFTLMTILVVIGFATYALLPNERRVSNPTVAPTPTHGAAPGGSAIIAGGAPATWDPALMGDAETADVLAQVYEGLTAFDADSNVQPALAQSWSIDDSGQRIVFQLRPDITFSDGTPITAQDVVDSWLRLLDPRRPSPLSSLLGDVVGASAYLSGQGDRASVGLSAAGSTVVVQLQRPAAYFVAVTASPSLAVVPPSIGDTQVGPDLPTGLVASGAYVPVKESDTDISLQANAHYWAGPPALATIDLVTDIQGQSPVAVFEAGQADWIEISPSDASWIRYDATLGPQLRHSDAFSVDYYGFDTTRAPFNDPLVRQAFAQAVDWHELARLADPDSVPATSLIPAGIPGRGDADLSPVHDPDAARAALAKAGFPGGAGFPTVTLTTPGSPYDDGVAKQLKDVLGITIAIEDRPFDEYSKLLDAATGRPQFWELTWIADFPAPQDFLGLLLGTGSASNPGQWSNSDFDADLAAAAATTDPTAQAAQYADAQTIVRDQAPVIPVTYGSDWALSRDGLLGAAESGVGLLRFGGLAWAPR